MKPDQMLGTYRLIGLIGAGGMGEVWKAEDTQLRRMVAIKVLPGTYAPDDEAIARMRREARTAAQLYHPNIAMIHEIDELEGRLFIVMELVEGEPLSRVIDRGPLPEAEVCRIGREIAEALEAAHVRGIIHRDVKPDNVIVAGSQVKVLDFGIARRYSADATVLTQQGMVLGTFLYMSPEQAVADPLDGRTDLFSLGIVLYEMAKGRVPFDGPTPSAALTKIILQEPPPLEGVSPGLAAIIMKCLQKQRDQRYATAGELAQALDAELGVLQSRATAPQASAPVAPATATPPPAAPPRKKTSATTVAIVALVIAIAASLAAVAIALRPDRKAEAAAPAVAASPSERVREGMALLGRDRPRAARRLLAAALQQRDQLSEDEAVMADAAVAVIDEDDVRAEALMEEFAEVEGYDAEYELLRRLLDTRSAAQGEAR